MTLTRLRELHANMRANDITRCRFNYTYQTIQFDVFFLTDQNPYILMFGIIGHNAAFKVEVHPGYNITPRIPNDIYTLICNILGLQADVNNPFRPMVIFEHFNENMNVNINRNNRAQSHQIAPYHPDVEEADKIYFLGWRNNASHEHVGDSNLDKTRRLLGEEAYLFSLQNNISTRWTADIAAAVEFFYPG